MTSRINIGPDGGPFIAINENSGDIELEDNSGTVVAKWDESASEWNLQNNPLANVASLETSTVIDSDTATTYDVGDDLVGGVQNPLTQTLDAAGNDVTNVGALGTTTLNGGGPVSEGDGIERQIYVIANGASDPAGADPEDIIFEEEI